jgi:adenine-specific DNA-methyltransferase
VSKWLSIFGTGGSFQRNTHTGKDLVYPDDFQDNIRNYLELTGQVDDGRKITSNTETSGRFHTDWLSMIYPRLKVARNLLRADGVVFISMDEREYSHLRTISAEIFGEENLIGTIVWKNVTDNNPTNVATEHEYLLIVGRSKDDLEKEWKSSVSDVKDVLVRIGSQLTSQFSGETLTDAYQKWFREHKSELWPLDRYKYIDAGGVYTGSQSVHNPGREGYRYDVIHPVTKRPCKQPLMGYRFPKATMDELILQGKILFGEDETKLIELKLREDFPDDGKVFDNPKPVRLLSAFFPFLLKHDGDFVIDFFAGSGTTARAVLELNRKDQVRRRYCLVQLPEPLDSDDNDQKIACKLCDKLGRPRNIAELAKERLRRAATRIKQENHLLADDLGFRVFKLASSNIRAWQPDRDNLDQSLLDSVEHLDTDRTEADILYELLLKLGLDLCVPMEKRTIAGKDVHAVGGGVLLACLATQITRAEVEPLGLGIVEWHKALAAAGDTTCVFRDSAFADDVAKTNLVAILNQHGITTVRSL